ncbi:MAG: stage III sporulation protein AB [Clostridia bacterium]|nr:stage III sporulation protein AB [Clostridia bacterium]
MRLLGALLCFFVSTCLGLSAGGRERARTEECVAFLSLFSHVQNQISYFSAPTKVIYRGIENGTLARIGFLDALCAHENDDIYFDVWSSALDSCEDKLHLTAEQMATVRAFGSCIGKTNGELQLRQMEYYANTMATETERQRSEMQKNIKVYRTLGFAAGAAMLLLVL